MTSTRASLDPNIIENMLLVLSLIMLAVSLRFTWFIIKESDHDDLYKLMETRLGRLYLPVTVLSPAAIFYASWAEMSLSVWPFVVALALPLSGYFFRYGL